MDSLLHIETKKQKLCQLDFEKSTEYVLHGLWINHGYMHCHSPKSLLCGFYEK